MNIKSINLALKDVLLKKKIMNKLRDQKRLLENVNHFDYKSIIRFETKSSDFKLIPENFVLYIVFITFTSSNTFFHISDYSGKVVFFYSAGQLGYSGKRKKSRFQIFKEFSRILVSRLKHIKGKPVAIHLTNVKSQKFWIIKRLKRFFFIKSVKIFSSYPHNGCRKKKLRRKKFKKRQKYLK